MYVCVDMHMDVYKNVYAGACVYCMYMCIHIHMCIYN